MSPVGQRTHSERTMREDWETPPSIFEPLHAEFRFTVDGAANEANAKLPRYYWNVDEHTELPPNERIWLNPPYGFKNLDFWIGRAYRASLMGSTVVCLVPANTGQPWWHKWVVGKASEIRWIKGKVKFVGAPSSAPFPSCILVFRPSESRTGGGTNG